MYYHLEQFNLSMRYALGAGARFDIFGKKSEFIETLVGTVLAALVTLEHLT